MQHVAITHPSPQPQTQALTETASARDTTRADGPRTPGGQLFRHRKRPSWGLATQLWDREGKRAYQFLDGRVRVFKRGYFEMLEPVHAPADAAAARSVRRLAARRRAGQSVDARDVPRVLDQVALFAKKYPDGFVGAAWKRNVRGQDAAKPLKRHRDHAIALARAQLDVGRVSEDIEFTRWDAVCERAVKVLRVTDLVRKAEVDQLAALRTSPALAWSIYDLLYNRKPIHARMDAFVKALQRLGLRASWQLATALLALRFPEQHICVRPSVLAEQARMVKPELKLARRPRGRHYVGYLEVAEIVKQELEAAGRAPQDLMDVAHFVWITLRRAAREHLIGAGDTLLVH